MGFQTMKVATSQLCSEGHVSIRNDRSSMRSAKSSVLSYQTAPAILPDSRVFLAKAYSTYRSMRTSLPLPNDSRAGRETFSGPIKLCYKEDTFAERIDVGSI